MPPRTAPFRSVLAAFFTTLAVAAAGAEPEVSLSTGMETVWRSDGGMVVTHNHAGEVVAGNGTIGLRGRFGVERSLALSGDAEEGTALEGALDLQAAVSPDTVLRASFALRHDEESETLLLPGQPVTALSPTLEMAGSVGLRRSFGATLLDLELGQVIRRPGESVFPGLPLLPERLAAETDLLRGAFSIEHALSPSLAVLARAEADRLYVSVEDTLLYGRLPAERLRLSTGLAMQTHDGMEGELRLEADIVSSPVLGEGRFIRPYGYGVVGMTLRRGFAVSVTAEAGTAFDEAADGFADWRWRVGAEAEMLLSARLALAAGLHVRGGEAVLVAAPLTREIEAQAGLTYALAPGLTIGARVGLAREIGVAADATDSLVVAASLRAEL